MDILSPLVEWSSVTPAFLLSPLFWAAARQQLPVVRGMCLARRRRRRLRFGFPLNYNGRLFHPPRGTFAWKAGIFCRLRNDTRTLPDLHASHLLRLARARRKSVRQSITFSAPLYDAVRTTGTEEEEEAREQIRILQNRTVSNFASLCGRERERIFSRLPFSAVGGRDGIPTASAAFAAAAPSPAAAVWRGFRSRCRRLRRRRRRRGSSK